MSTSVFGVALSGLNAAQLGLQTTGHNLANVNTPGFSRQQIVQTQSPGQFTGAGFVGAGSQVQSVKRVYADYLITQAQGLAAQEAQSAAYAGEIGRLSSMLADPDINLGGALDGFFAGLRSLAGNPGDTVARQSFLSGAQSLVARFRALDASLADMQSSVDGQIRSSVDLINGHAKAVAELNHVIAGANGGQPPNDLLDRRDQLIADLNNQVRAVAVSDGSVNLYLANGQPLVMGINAQALVVSKDSLDGTKLVIGASNGTFTQVLRQDEITGGALGGMLAFREQSLQPVRNELGRIAMALGAAINAQHRLGQDRNGASGGDVFRIAAPGVSADLGNSGNAVLSAVINDYGALSSSDYRVDYDGGQFLVTRLADGATSTYATLPATLDGMTLSIGAGAPALGDSFLIQPTRNGASGLSLAIGNTAQIAAAVPVRTASSAANLGSGVISSGQVQSLDVNLLQPVTLTFTGPGTFSVTGVGTGDPVGLAFVEGQDISFNGWTVNITGTPRVGDTFAILPNGGAAGDGRNAGRLADLAQSPLVDGVSVSSAYGRVVSSTGARAQEINLAQKAQESLLQNAKESIASVSGINLDEEAANLLRYQQAYQAAGKVISVANSLFDSLLRAMP